MKTKNMWGDFKDLKVTPTPRKYLQEQANNLFKLTDEILKAEVSSERIGGRYDLAYRLRIIAPRINNYTKTIITIKYALIPYPLLVLDHVNEKSYECEDESIFLDLLEEILSSPKVREIIESLISHST